MIKKILIYILLILLSLSLLSCGKQADEQSNVLVKFGEYVLEIPSNYFLVSNFNDNLLKDIDIIYAYRLSTSKNDFSPSLLVGKYKLSYPTDTDYFFHVILDKFKKNVSGFSVIDTDKFKLSDNNLAYYVTYLVDDNLFGNDKENIYYGLQVYLFDKTEKKVYVISYVSLEEKDINTILDNVKNLKINE